MIPSSVEFTTFLFSDSTKPGQSHFYRFANFGDFFHRVGKIENTHGIGAVQIHKLLE
jgi:hypothetical protein